MSSGFKHFRIRLQTVTVILLWSVTQIASADPSDTKRQNFFESRIRPVLVTHCYKCHSKDEAKGGLRLDHAAGLTSGGDSGPAVVSGKPEESILIEAIRFDGLEMPPDGRLTESIVKDFEQWVRDGVFDPRTDSAPKTESAGIDIDQGRRFWAFQPVLDNRPPATASNSPVDQFIDSNLKAAGLNPASPADRSTLIRRLYLDLTGLPPTTEQFDAADSDESADAVDRLIDELLDSPQYGVHWGRYWLDVARYADSNGGDFNATFHNAWRYRDYVIDSFNRDIPFDTFVREQLAGDLLPYDDDIQRTRQLIATGFLMIGTKMLSERDKEKLTMDVVDEQVSTVGSAFLGLTLGCCRCHDHKFDPIPSRDYYAMAGIFRSTRTLKGESQKYVSTWERINLPATKAQTTAIRDFEAEEKNLSSAISNAKKQIEALQKDESLDPRFIVDDAAARKSGDWQVSTRTPGYVGTSYLHDNRANKGAMSIEYRWKPPRSGRYEVRLSYIHGSTRAASVPVRITHAEGTSKASIDQTKEPKYPGLFAPVGEFTFDASAEAVVVISNAGTSGFVIADAVQFAEITDNQASDADTGSDDQRFAAQIREQQQQLAKLEAALKELRRNRPAPLPQAIAAVDVENPTDCAIRIRGEHKNLGATVPRGFIQVALPDSGAIVTPQSSGRRELAEWIVDPAHPLTGRVIVNRVWAHLFGQGLVRTVDNFGQLGERPSHPQLLDHLAKRFVTAADRSTESGAPGFGWSIRSLIRELVRTRAYQRSTSYDESSWQKDPENRLLWRMNRRRIPAEAIRDGMLTVSRRLDLSPGGSPVEGLGTLVKSNSADAGDYQRAPSAKRSIYLPIIRNELPSVLTIFDFADPDFVVGKRPVTNVPAQALFLLNSPFVMDNARETAKWILADASVSTRSVIEQSYRSVLSRKPDKTEFAYAAGFLQDDFELSAKEDQTSRLAKFIHVLLASSEFRMLD